MTCRLSRAILEHCTRHRLTLVDVAKAQVGVCVAIHIQRGGGPGLPHQPTRRSDPTSNCPSSKLRGTMIAVCWTAGVTVIWSFFPRRVVGGGG